MPTTGRLGLLLGGVGVVTLVAAMAASIAAGAASDAPVPIDVHFSRFAPEAVRVRAGVPVTFVIRNSDPIDHEWIVGDAETHARHRTGTEPVHASRPTEVSVPALQTVSTTVIFDAPGELRFVCHLPGHEAYGMSGTLIVEP